MTTLRTQRLTLRRPNPSDWPAFRDFMMGDRSTAFGSHMDLGKTFRSFAAELGHWEIFGYGMWAVTLTGGDDRAVALVGPWSPPDWPEREVGWMVLAPEAEGVGIAFEAARAALDHAFDELGWDTAVSYVADDNLRSAALAARLGARLDPEAARPVGPRPLLVYRHRRPETAAAEPRRLRGTA